MQSAVFEDCLSQEHCLDVFSIYIYEYILLGHDNPLVIAVAKAVESGTCPEDARIYDDSNWDGP